VAEALGPLEEGVTEVSLVALLEVVELAGEDTDKLCQSRNSERKIRKEEV
jgi:hypothetical protein